MAVPPIVKATLQAVVINAGSNVLAQYIKAYRNDIPFEIDTQALTQFTTCAIITTPLNFIWQNNLEATFPGTIPQSTAPKHNEKSERSKPEVSKPALNVTNTITKVVIDQTIGGTWNTVLFILTMGLLRGQHHELVFEQIRETKSASSQQCPGTKPLIGPVASNLSKMVSGRTFPFVRPRRNSKKQKNKTGTRLPSPLRLEGSFFHSQVRKDITVLGPFPRAVRGSISNSSDKEKKGHRDDEAQEVPLKMEVFIAQGSFEPAQEPLAERPPPLEPTKTFRPVETNHHQRSEPATSISKRVSPEPSMPTRSVSPQESLRTMIDLDTPGSSDDEESDISPLSDDRPSAAARSGAALRRFFPELSSSNFAVVSPMSADADADQQHTRPMGFPSIFETELHERVHALYKNSTDAIESPSTDVDQALERKTGSSSRSGSEDVFDCASSCYSRRSSITSVDTESFSPATNELDRYSIFSPVAAGVFNDSASTCPSRAASFASRVPSDTAPSPGYPASSLYSSTSVPPSRRASISSKLSLNDIKNKPLPLEPVQEPSPLAIRHNDHTPSSATTKASRSTGFHSTYLHPNSSYSATSLQWKQSGGQVCHNCEGCGRSSIGDSSQSRWGRRPEWSETRNGQRMRHVPTLAQAAEELEFALADLARDPHMQQRTLLVLDGPLQISRHNGDLVATRPAPLPPSTKPHSKSFKKSRSIHTKAKAVEDSTVPRSATFKSLHATKERASPPLPDKDSKNKDEAAPKDNNPLKTKDEAEWPSNSSTSNFNTDDISKTPKMKKSFTLTMPSFKRTHTRRVRTLQEPRLSVVLSSRSETLLVDPHASEARPERPPRLSSHSGPSLDWDADEKVDSDLDAGTASKRDDLLLQLPRLQTQDLGLQIPSEPLSTEKELLAQIQTKQTQPQPEPKQMQGTAPSPCAPGPPPKCNINIPTPRRRPR
ncbi:hypothetical protein PEBR_06170 [Penicillium brasilianum]|uniref:Uncharacterized protein n=1 Tax=Penicillium brasilianum TaxID=104259 RepID=A0A1S9RXQ1_PENBI|nr:hypothetical protein PEBR_06170 [Penicillium brasilianum]